MNVNPSYERSDFSMAKLIDGDNVFENCAVVLRLPNHLDIRFNCEEDKNSFEKTFCKKEMSKELKVIRHGFPDLLLTSWVAVCNMDLPPKLVASVTFHNAFSVRELNQDNFPTSFKEIFIEYPFFYQNMQISSLIDPESQSFMFFENDLIRINFCEDIKSNKSYVGKNLERKEVNRYFHIVHKDDSEKFFVKDIFSILEKINYFFTVIFQYLPIEPERIYFSSNANDHLLFKRKFSKDVDQNFIFQRDMQAIKLFDNFYTQYHRLKFSCYILNICNFAHWSIDGNGIEHIFLFNGCAHALDEITKNNSKDDLDTQLISKLETIRDQNSFDKNVFSAIDGLIKFQKNQKESYRDRLIKLIKSLALNHFKNSLSDKDKIYLKQKKPEFKNFVDGRSPMELYSLFNKDSRLLSKMSNTAISNIVAKIHKCRTDLSHGRAVENINLLIKAYIDAKVVLRLAIISIVDDKNLIDKSQVWLNSREELSRYYLAVE
ncbi:hypothetical protein [Francisella tularensis]|uniref:hypothetical protein n=1 Tax=Francisella tularensis TaxID=263 RepID=UPI0018AD1D76|nr:hypothetical protein [Francisella tularensis]